MLGQARRRSGAARTAIVTAVGGGEGYNSDEEVYATEAALAAGAGEDYDSDGNLNGSGKQTQVLACTLVLEICFVRRCN